MPRTHHQGLHEFIETHVAGRPAPPRPTESTGGGGGRWASMTPAMRMGIRVANQVSVHLKWAAGVAEERPPPLEGKRCTHARAILAAFRRWQWTPVPDAGGRVAEVPVLVRPWCLATKIDALLYCKRTNRLVVVEIKNGVEGASRRGFEGRPGGGGARFAPPFSHVPDTPLNRARVQAMLCLAMLKRDARYTDLVARFAGRLSVFVVRCTGESVTRYVVGDAWCIDLVNHYHRVLGAAGPNRIRDTLPAASSLSSSAATPPASPTSDSSPDASNRHDEPTGPDVAICPITQRALVDAVAVPCCGNLFSRAALATALHYKPTCPLCRTDLTAHIAATETG